MDLQALKASLNSQRGHLTRRTKTLERRIEFVHTNPTSMGVAELLQALQKFKEQGEKVEALYIQLQDVDEDESHTDEYGHKLTELSDMTDQVVERAMKVVMLAGKHPTQQPETIPESNRQIRPKVMESLKPNRLKLDNTPTEMRCWMKEFRAFYTTSSLDKYSVPEQHAFIFSCMEVDLKTKIMESDTFDEELPIFGDVSIIQVVQEEFLLRYPLFNRRLDFFKYRQSDGQKFSDFSMKLRQKGEEASLETLQMEELYIFRYVTGTVDEKLRDRFLRLNNPTLEDLKSEVRSYEVGKQAVAAMDQIEQVAQVKNQPGKSMLYKRVKAKSNIQIPLQLKGKCLRCGDSNHLRGVCNKQYDDCFCKYCKKQGHLDIVCFRKIMKQEERPKTQLRCIEYVESSDSEELVSTVTCQQAKMQYGRSSKPTPKIKMKFLPMTEPAKNFTLNATPDTGATRTVIAKDALLQYKIKYKPATINLYAANGNQMNCEGQVELQTACSDGKMHTIYAIVSSDIQNDILLSWHDCQAVGIIPKNFPNMVQTLTTKPGISNQIDAIKAKYNDVLSDKLKPGKVMEGLPMKIKLKENVYIRPYKVVTAKQIPLHWQDAANKEIQDLLDKGVIVKVNKPTRFISSAHFVQKGKDNSKDKLRLRLVTNYMPINPYIERPVHPFPGTQDILRQIKPSSTWFAKLDAVQGYFQIPLDEESSYLTTFLLPSGRYRYTRAPMGLCASGDEWCHRSDQALEGLEGVTKLVDDILIQAVNETELLKKLEEVLERCRKHGISISHEKLQLGKEVKFAGHIVSKKGIRPDPDKVKAIANFREPRDVSELRSFLGLANQLGLFIPDMAELTVNLRQLLKKEVAYTWLPDHQQDFEKIKRALTSDLVVQHFDTYKRTELLTDASRLHGLGYALMQTDKEGQSYLIRCGSKAITETQARYATIELECLAAQWAMDKCSFYLKGCPSFKLITDHRPLVGIFKKPMHQIQNPRLQTLRGKMSGYNFETQWKPGKHHQIADALSRAPVDKAENEEADTVIVSTLTTGNPAIEFIRNAAEFDEEYQQIVQALKTGKYIHTLIDDHPAKQFKNIWSELSLLDDSNRTLILFGTRIVIPKQERKNILKLLHKPHAGIIKTKQQARQLYYWPGMNSDIVNTIEGCQACQENLCSQTVEPLLEDTLNISPMSHVGIDLFDAAGKNWIVMVDRYSGFPFVCELKRTDTGSVIKVLKHWFYDWGVPQVIRSDGGPQFRNEFNTFCKDFHIEHELSSPYNPRSNGLAESAVKATKALLLKCLKTKEDYKSALFEYRNCPRADGFSPSQMFIGRRQKGCLPALTSAYSPIDMKDAEQARMETKRKAAAQLNSHAHPLKELSIGQKVRVQHPLSKKWNVMGEVIDKMEHRPTYTIQTDTKTLKRNRRYLRPIKGEHMIEDTGTEEHLAEDEKDGVQQPRRSQRLMHKQGPTLQRTYV